ncbi:MAG: hypothetical protein M3416_13595 [Acidobacteriota bacterium]|nr:hypothetical protein [Acidobacteriota bacterium]
MNESDIRRISNGLKQGPGYVAEGKLSTFKIVPIEMSDGRASVYLVVWRDSDGEPLFLNLLPAGKWNESLMNELIVRLKQAIDADDERTLQKQLSEIAQFIKSLTNEQDAEYN